MATPRKRLANIRSKDRIVGKLRRAGQSAEFAIGESQREFKRRKKRGQRESFRQIMGKEMIYRTPFD